MAERGARSGVAAAFLDAVQRPTAPPVVTPPPVEWQILPSTPAVVEYAVWLNAAVVDHLHA